MFSLGLFSNPWLWPGVLAMLLAQAAFIYLPIMNWLFHSAPIGRDEWLLTLAAGLVIYVIIGTEKLITRYILERRVKTTATGNVTRHSPSS
jgi:magnesium-transporting ATPase (P-type)